VFIHIEQANAAARGGEADFTPPCEEDFHITVGLRRFEFTRAGITFSDCEQHALLSVAWVCATQKELVSFNTAGITQVDAPAVVELKRVLSCTEERQ
jgi:hypothetical protein